MFRSYWIFPALVASLLCASGRVALAQEPVDENQALMDLYFSDDRTVEVTARAPRPLTQVAENVTVIDAEEIEAMHAHTILEVLERLPGLFVFYFGQDFGSNGGFTALGSRPTHTLVLLDGVRLNGASGGDAFVNFVPVGIVKRIEVIKGPASSAWGSALGGVVNIITKEPGQTARPQVGIVATYGEAASREFAGEVAGRAGALRYYLHGSAMDSDGLTGDRFFDRETFYGKAAVDLSPRTTLTVVAGASDPYCKTADFRSLDFRETARNRNFWGTLYLDHGLTDQLNLHLALQRYERDVFTDRRVLGLGLKAGGANALFNSEDWDEWTTTVSSRLDYSRSNLQVTVGAETSRSQLDYFLDYGPEWGGPASEDPSPASEERRGLYANATFILGRLSVSPGFRYDFHSITDEFHSPSLGATYRLADDTLLRATVAKGFAAPYLALISDAGGQWAMKNPELRPEEIWSCQAGIETTRYLSMRLKATAFHQQVEESWAANNDLWIWENRGRTRWAGVEVEAATSPWHHLRLSVGGAYVREDSAVVEGDDSYGASVVVDYDDTRSWRGQFAGRYVWYNEFSRNERPLTDNFIWDASLSKTLFQGRVATDLFVKVHNLFNGGNYWDYEYPNPGRWLEAGVSLRF
ncbi:MAG: TonB-dependent receptor [Desulfobulbaceae bacterium]|nr:TonB-dependent receptor [Desulfobulbaceae bacterium]